MDSFGSRLKAVAKSHFGGVGVLAERLGVLQPHLSQYISGRNKPGLDFIEKLASLGININWLLTGIGDMLFTQPSPLEERVRAIEEKISKADREKNIRESIEAARVEYIGDFPNAAGEAILSYDRLKAAATPHAPKSKKKKGE